MYQKAPYSDTVRWRERVGTWGDARRFTLDAFGTALLALALVPTAIPIDSSFPGSRWWALALVLPLAWRRTHPGASAATVYSVALAHLFLGPLLIMPVDLVVLLALYSVTVHGPRWAYRTAIGGALLGGLVLGAVLTADVRGRGLGLETGVFSAVAVALLAVAAFAFGLVRRSRREVIGSLVDRAQRLEVEGQQQAQIAAAAERTRIAREMHDIVAHSLSVIIAQADGGRYAAEAEPAAAVRSLTTIGETGRAALTDMRRLLGVLRPPEQGSAETTDADTGAGPSGTPGPVDLVPQPAVADIERLVDQVRDSGMEVSVVRIGTARPLPPGTGLTVYRICQESLTNVLKHGGPGVHASVLLQWAPRALVLEVTDDGRGAASTPDGGGHGQLGMRERAVMLGGTLTLGPRPGGGYRVRAEIPLPPVAGITASTAPAEER